MQAFLTRSNLELVDPSLGLERYGGSEDKTRGAE